MSMLRKESAAALPMCIVVGVIFGAVCALGLVWVLAGVH
ncbi:unknown protein [Azorhizobium caulinodans ORS 571]|jgi:hypothetical protein|uniref:Uncharacterized protein n=1 Tax=Azorhizobium caulinodans (strain ATCC 43989 / DSM 5975 / JCM 20966 / LMG 6465 / NBRC 14845 / NCIMB 13405 / ORS 571) TaxID=438753 RepID=A8HW08_AZOC5|nr:unknown protein [Azorhizobium caulinodans ORS 571]